VVRDAGHSGAWPAGRALRVQGCAIARAGAARGYDPPVANLEKHEMGLSTHVLDTAHGCPAAGMRVTLQRLEGGQALTLRTVVLNQDGRAEGGLLDAAAMAAGRYRLVFEVAAYFRARGVALPEPPFLETVPLEFGIADPQAHYHVPLLCSPWSYSTYRGS
jgi:5-hydroxyisourate hydrolase